MSDTVGKELYYCAIRLDDGSVLRLARPMDSLIRTAWNILPVMLVLSVIGIALALFLKLADEASDGTGDASGSGASSGQCDLS